MEKGKRMNIRQAKEYIKNSVSIYLKKSETGNYRVPVVRQRPIFLLGAPGIGKTAIMEQVAQEMGIAIISYSMTHHTRQSALGLPVIKHRVYEGMEYEISEYTMSEIIASIYEIMENSGIKEGILFLDEINCVSETLAPSMLQFLQYKVFGRHRVPDGWVIVTAGNPPEYNKSVREFDVVTLDRLRILEVEPDYSIWREYAIRKRLHNAIVTYLDMKKDHFYHIEMTTKGRSYVTARGWEDLSEILHNYEEENILVEESLIVQYLHNEKIAKEFCAYYDLYNKYKKDYKIQEILTKEPSANTIERAKNAAFDERLSLLGMLLDKVLFDISQVMEQVEYLSEVRAQLLVVKNVVTQGDTKTSDVIKQLAKLKENKRKQIVSLYKANTLSTTKQSRSEQIIDFLDKAEKKLSLQEAGNGLEAFGILKEEFDHTMQRVKEKTKEVGDKLHCLFRFAEEAFQEGNEILILVTELTVNTASAQFIADFGCEDYHRHNDSLMLNERHKELQKKIVSLEL